MVLVSATMTKVCDTTAWHALSSHTDQACWPADVLLVAWTLHTHCCGSPVLVLGALLTRHCTARVCQRMHECVSVLGLLRSQSSVY